MEDPNVLTAQLLGRGRLHVAKDEGNSLALIILPESGILVSQVQLGNYLDEDYVSCDVSVYMTCVPSQRKIIFYVS